ncbi:MAG TPA: hypothetical protein VGO56_15170 [Pyrinomonadaceae bacterium]|jgi:hypothetical protein|nr:hypothetical protein [Pyrinomonadaceae bacterium]
MEGVACTGSRAFRNSNDAHRAWVLSHTELLTEDSTNYPVPSIDDYAEKTRETVKAWKGMSGQQSGDPAKLANALMQLIKRDDPPLRWPAGADAVETFEKHILVPIEKFTTKAREPVIVYKMPTVES